MIFVSVIISTRNAAKTLESCLLSIKEQTYQNFELLIVDRDSIDKTKEIAKNFTDNVFNFGPERSAQRNFGAQKAKGEYLLFLDADMKLEPKVIEEAVKLVANENGVKVVIIPEISVGIGFWSKVKSFERSFYQGDSNIEAPRFIEKKLFQTVGGYDRNLVAGEDWDLSYRLKKYTVIKRIEVPIYHDEGDLSLVRTASKKYYYGKKISQFLKKRNYSISQITPFRSSFLKNKTRLLKSPLLTLGLFILKTTEFSAASLGLLVSLFSRQRKGF